MEVLWEGEKRDFTQHNKTISHNMKVRYSVSILLHASLVLLSLSLTISLSITLSLPRPMSFFVHKVKCCWKVPGCPVVLWVVEFCPCLHNEINPLWCTILGAVRCWRYTLNIKRCNRAKSVCTVSLVSVYLGVIDPFAKGFHKVMHRNDTMLVQYTVLDQINISLQIVVLG